jgi:DNA polymerase-1|tara:strand:- start:2797 stop:3690 length:894 start_codon:yes stop_codon:yes gene_type:complete
VLSGFVIVKIALIDGFNLVFRAYYGMPELTRKDGFPTGALHGWVRSLWWVADRVEPDRIIVFFDLGAPKRQLDLHPDYKANRGDTPEDLVKQIPVVKEWTRAMGYGGIEQDGVEADDLIGAYAKRIAERGDEAIIVSADKDLAQLVGPQVSQLLPPPTANPRLGWRRLDSGGVEDKFGIPPKLIPDYLALIGDTSDNIPGVKGVGPKTAVKWLRQYRSIEGVIENCGEIMPKRFQRMVHAQQDDIRRNLKMTLLETGYDCSPLDAPIPIDEDRAIGLLEEMEMTASAQSARKRLGRE